MSRTPIRDESFPSRQFVLSCPRPLESPRTRQSGPPIVIPAKAGIQRGGGRQDRRQSCHVSRTPIRDESFPSRPLVSSCGVRWNPPALVSPAPPFRHSGEGGNPRGEVWGVATTPELSHQPMHPIFTPRCAAPTGTSDSYENDATQPQERPNATALALVSPAPQSSFRRRPESRGAVGGKTAASLDTKASPGLRSGMNRSRHDRRSRHAGARWNPLALVTPAPQSSFRRKRESRGAVGGKTAASLGTKACPGLRSGIRGTSQTDESRSFRSSTICYPCARSVPAISLSPWERAG